MEKERETHVRVFYAFMLFLRRLMKSVYCLKEREKKASLKRQRSRSAVGDGAIAQYNPSMLHLAPMRPP